MKSVFLLPLVVALVLLTTNVANAQPRSSRAKRLRSPAMVRGFIGGESHDNYVIYVRKGQTLTVRLSWQRKGDNGAAFTIGESPDYYTREPVKYGMEFDDGRRWVGKVPRSRNYYIDVVAHPAAHYMLTVRVT